MGEVIVVTSGKGGTGKSTTCAALGVAIARRGKSALLIDTDCGLRCLDLLLGVSEKILFDLGDVLMGNCEPLKSIYPVSGFANKLSVMPAPNSVDSYGLLNDLSRLVKGLSAYYDYVLIDSPAGLDIGFKATCAVADMVLVVVTPEPSSIRDGEKTAQHLFRDIECPVRLIINRFKRALLKNQAAKNIDAIIDKIGVQLIAVVPDDKSVSMTVAVGKPLPEKSPAGAAFSRLADRIQGANIPFSGFGRI